ncbi:MAG TPA: thioredoxin [Planctomycetaceae bacterium]|nr:thioredoxin [Planctomycetaceae bacterium]
MNAINVNGTNFKEQVELANGPVLVDFWAPWCGPCRAMTGVVDEVAEAMDGQARVVKANVDETGSAAARYGIQAIPAFLVLEGGEVKERLTGVVTRETILDALRAHLSS